LLKGEFLRISSEEISTIILPHKIFLVLENFRIRKYPCSKTSVLVNYRTFIAELVLYKTFVLETTFESEEFLESNFCVKEPPRLKFPI